MGPRRCLQHLFLVQLPKLPLTSHGMASRLETRPKNRNKQTRRHESRTDHHATAKQPANKLHPNIIHFHLHCLSRLVAAGLLICSHHSTVVGSFQSGCRAEFDAHCRHGTAYGRVPGWGKSSRGNSSLSLTLTHYHMPSMCLLTCHRSYWLQCCYHIPSIFKGTDYS